MCLTHGLSRQQDIRFPSLLGRIIQTSTGRNAKQQPTPHQGSPRLSFNSLRPYFASKLFSKFLRCQAGLRSCNSTELGSFWWIKQQPRPSQRMHPNGDGLYVFLPFSPIPPPPSPPQQIPPWQRPCGHTSMSAPTPTGSSASMGRAASWCRRTSRRVCKRTEGGWGSGVCPIGCPSAG